MDQLLIRARWQVGRLARQLGAFGGVGIAILIVCLVAVVFGLAPQYRQIQAAARDLSAQKGAAPSVAIAGPAAGEEQLAAFYAALPNERQSAAIVGSLVAIARGQGITLSEGDFKLSVDDASTVVKYQIAFPAKAEYRQAREFIREAMRRYPSLALEGISFRRDNADSLQLDCQLQLALYMTSASQGVR
jgi:hypothetical protein